MTTQQLKAGLLSLALLAAAPIASFTQSENQGQGRAVVTLFPANGSEQAPAISPQDLAVRINGKEATIRNWIPLRGPNDPVELVILLDSGARSSMGSQLSEIDGFVRSLPPNAKVALAWMENGIARLSGPLTADHDAALKGLHIPAGSPGASASPYFCLSNLAQHWPSDNRAARREVVMITDGIDNYNRAYDPSDPYVAAAVADSVRAGLVVYSIYWMDTGRLDRTNYGANDGQNLMLQVTQATGGNSYWQGLGNPVSFQPFFKDLNRRLQNQYELSFTAPLKNKPEVQQLKLKVTGITGKIDAPQKVYVYRQM